LTPKTKLKKKKRLRFDNSPYGQIIPEVKKRYSQIPYRWTTVGSMDHLDAATLTEFQDFNEILHPITPFL
jgi:hypothetical protein